MIERLVFSECVIGYRSWRLADWVLAPVSFGDPWRPGVNHAVCKADETRGLMYAQMLGDTSAARKKHTAPHQNCTCGLHAYHAMPAQDKHVVIGAVAAWGDLQVHSNGFRAERAEILALVAARGLEEVADLYGVPLVSRDMLAMEALQYGSPLPESMRPEPPKPAELDRLTFGNLYSNLLSQQLYSQPINWTWSTATVPLQAPSKPPKSSGKLWTPDDDAGKTPAEKLARYLKKPANRQGPHQKQRPPRGSWSGQ